MTASLEEWYQQETSASLSHLQLKRSRPADIFKKKKKKVLSNSKTATDSMCQALLSESSRWSNIVIGVEMDVLRYQSHACNGFSFLP